MLKKPKITISEDDCDRIELLVNHLKSNKTVIQLLEELDRADIVASTDMPTDVVRMQSKITFTVLSTGKTLTYTLVYPEDVSESSDLSILTPMGSALLGLSIGSEIEWPIDGQKSILVKIDNVLNT